MKKVIMQIHDDEERIGESFLTADLFAPLDNRERMESLCQETNEILSKKFHVQNVRIETDKDDGKPYIRFTLRRD